MPSSNQITYQLGCDPVVTLVVTEDEGSIVMQLFGADDATDIDGFFFNLNDDSVSPTLTIFPKVDDPNGDVIDFRAEPGILNQLDNGAQTSEQFDVEVQFGEFPGSNAGQINETGFTLYLDGNRPLTLDDIDFSKMVAVVDSDNGEGVALVGGTGGESNVAVVETAIDATFDGYGAVASVDGVASSDGWYLGHGAVSTNGCHDGTLRFDTVQSAGAVTLTLDIRAVNAQNFEATGHYADDLRIEVQLDDGAWVLLDEFVVDPATDTFTGSESGQVFNGHEFSQLSYEGGILEDIDGDVTFRVVSDISASNEIIRIDNVEITTTTIVDGTEPTETVIASEDFDGLHDPSQSDAVAYDGRWDVRDGELYTNGHNDGHLVFEEIPADGPVEFSIDARAINLHNFEATGHYADNISIEVQIDGGHWVLLDDFRVSADDSALVGNQTGQQITENGGTLDYSGGILDDAEESVQFRIVSDISASDEAVTFDNFEVRLIGDDEQCEDFDSASSGDVVADQFAGVTISGQRAGDDASSENDAMIFDTNAPTGGDHDLAYANQGNAIIISEDNDSSDADDNAGGGTLSFDFDAVSSVSSLTVLDIEEPGGSIDLFDADGELINSIEIPAAGDNSATDIDINATGVASMNVNLVGSGAIDDLCYAAEGDDHSGVFCDQYMVEYDELVFPKADDELDDQQADAMDDMMV